MNGIALGKSSHTHNIGKVQITVLGRHRADAVSFIRQSDMQRIPVRLRIDRYGGDPQFTAGSYDADRDFAAVGDQHFLNVHAFPPKV
ncbi:hypothetical protein D3C73_1405770 [compost metagenome]